ncbi:hypothetical protein [Romboutsia lituseburensis]|uniref:hypothetical protein n=1 Tax=Romboutsia lituseburensis TaxID=1537 RepID=UPI00215AF259|nr:hypothetical protein [Romboutsia lituseburensis]MCR8744253.1 hypothetical protein [Romboutsia lituseburensis]
MDNLSALIIGASIAISGYYIGNGISKGLIFFKSNNSNYSSDKFGDILFQENEDIFNTKLVKKKYIAKKLGVSKHEVDYLIKEYPNIKYININGNIYYDKSSVQNWIDKIGE